jgi:hypothetical protein
MPMIAITINNSISVNPRCCFFMKKAVPTLRRDRFSLTFRVRG